MIRILTFFLFLFTLLLLSSSAVASKQDALLELAKSQNLKEILQANQKADQEEFLRGACQQQITEKHWPTSCWEWLERSLNHNELSNKKKRQWILYLEVFCRHLAQRQESAKFYTTNSKLWKNSRCASLTKKLGLGFEDITVQ